MEYFVENAITISGQYFVENAITKIDQKQQVLYSFWATFEPSWGGLGASPALLGPVLDQPGAAKKPKEPPKMALGPAKGSPKVPDWRIFC